jgi:flagellar biosynthesis/type III secretory pathway protein FliH
MANKIEQLHDKIFGTHKTITSGTGEGSSFGHYPQMPTEEEFDAAISAARQEGYAEGHAEDIEGLQVKFKETLAKARAEGAEQTKAELSSSVLTSWCGKSDEYGDMLMMPAAVLAPKEKP